MTKQKQRLAEGARRSPAYGDLSLLRFILNIDSLLYYILVMYTIVTKENADISQRERSETNIILI